MNETLEQILQELKRLSEGQARLESDLSDVKKLAQTTASQVGVLNEFKTEMNQFRDKTAERLDKIESILCSTPNPDIEEPMAAYESGSRRYRNALRELAK